MCIKFNDEYYMKLAYKYAKLAYEKDEVPVGAVIVKNNIVLAKSYNLGSFTQTIPPSIVVIW